MYLPTTHSPLQFLIESHFPLKTLFKGLLIAYRKYGSISSLEIPQHTSLTYRNWQIR